MPSSDRLDADSLLDVLDLATVTAAEAAEVARGLRTIAALPAPTHRDRQAVKALRDAAAALDVIAARN